MADIEEITICDKGPLREVIVQDRVRIRLKRHYGTGAIATYPTDEALRFYGQDSPKGQLVLFDDLPEMMHLVFGYIWDRDLGEMDAATVSYPVSTDRPLWIREIGTTSSARVIRPARPLAPKPTIRIPEDGAHTDIGTERQG